MICKYFNVNDFEPTNFEPTSIILTCSSLNFNMKTGGEILAI